MPFGAPATVSTTPIRDSRSRRKSPSATRPYRCFYAPVDRNGFPTNTDTGVLPFVDLKAASGEAAQRKAHAKTGCPVASVERLEHAE